MSNPDNPRAFPCAASGDDQYDAHLQEGMTLRDWYAGQALPAAITEALRLTTQEDADRSGWPSRAAFIAYTVADAMIEERGKRPT